MVKNELAVNKNRNKRSNILQIQQPVRDGLVLERFGVAVTSKADPPAGRQYYILWEMLCTVSY